MNEQIKARHRYLIGFVVAPLFPVLLTSLFWAALSVDGSGNRQTTLFVLVLSLVLSYGLSVLVGLPAIVLFSALKRLSIVSLTVSGLLLGPLAWMIVEMVITSLLGGGPRPDLSPVGLLFGALFGFGTALLFALIAGLPLMPVKRR